MADDLEQMRWETLVGGGRRIGSPLARSAALALRERAQEFREEDTMFDRALDARSQEFRERSWAQDYKLREMGQKITISKYLDDLQENESKVKLSAELEDRLARLAQPESWLQTPAPVGSEEHMRKAISIMADPKYAPLLIDNNSLQKHTFLSYREKLMAIEKQKADAAKTLSDLGILQKQGLPTIPGVVAKGATIDTPTGKVTYETPEGAKVTEVKITKRDEDDRPTESVTRTFTEGAPGRKKSVDDFIKDAIGQ